MYVWNFYYKKFWNPQWLPNACRVKFQECALVQKALEDLTPAHHSQISSRSRLCPITMEELPSRLSMCLAHAKLFDTWRPLQTPLPMSGQLHPRCSQGGLLLLPVPSLLRRALSDHAIWSYFPSLPSSSQPSACLLPTQSLLFFYSVAIFSSQHLSFLKLCLKYVISEVSHLLSVSPLLPEYMLRHNWDLVCLGHVHSLCVYHSTWHWRIPMKIYQTNSRWDLTIKGAYISHECQ